MSLKALRSVVRLALGTKKKIQKKNTNASGCKTGKEQLIRRKKEEKTRELRNKCLVGGEGVFSNRFTSEYIYLNPEGNFTPSHKELLRYFFLTTLVCILPPVIAKRVACRGTVRS